jgi:vancomycin resistance protein YoaR
MIAPTPPRPEGHRPYVWIAVATVIGVLLGLALVPSAPAVPSSGRLPLHLLGRELPIGSEALELATHWIQQRLGGSLSLELPDGERRTVSYDALGVRLDAARLRALLRDGALGGAGTALTDGRAALELVVPVTLERGRALGTLLALKDDVDRAPADARLDVDHQAVVPERPGRLLDIDRSLSAIEQAVEAGNESVRLAFEVTQAERSSSELANVRYEALLGFFETPYDAASRAKDRTFNLRLAASKLDGFVLMPGATFDFNEVVGPRDEANGYRVAKVIAEGELVDGIGGGTCQISGTLHAAALFAGLDVVERHPHTRPSSYIKLGFDAAVAYPAINFRLKNPYDFPLVLRETVVGGRVRAEVRGVRRPFAITVVRKIDAATPYEQLEKNDESLPRGVRVLGQRGVPGITLHRYRIRRAGAHARREVVIDRYPPTPQLVRVGTGSTPAGTAGRPSNDPAPEYLADELLVLTQTDKLDAPLLEQRVAGRFGASGWTKEIGAPAWISPPPGAGF